MNDTAPRSSGKVVLYVMIACAVALAGVYGWKEFEIRGMRADFAQREAEFTQERAEQDVLMQARESRMRMTLLNQSKELLGMCSLALGRAVRPNELRAADGRLDDYFNKLVKQPSVERVVLVNPQGKVVRSTDQKQMNEEAAKFYWGLSLEGETQVQDAGEEIRIVVPVMDGTVRLGTLIATFSKSALTRRLSE